jgi:NADPH:quinone reductase-like Zn-dependent oxidoreductase
VKTYEIATRDGKNILVLAGRDEPRLGPRQVLVRVRAVSLNYRDLIVLSGMLGPVSKPDLVPVSDGAGEVVQVGSDTTRWKPGDRVAPIFRQRWLSGSYVLTDSTSDLGGGVDGVLTEYIALDEEGLVELPAHLSFEEGATLPCAAVTAWNAVVTRGKMRAGETVVVQGSGGVALFALQFAKASGARVIATTSSREKAERLKMLGADEVINYTTSPDWASEVLKFTAGRGAEVVIDSGGPGTWSRSIGAAAVGGRVLLVGLLTGIDESQSGPVFMPIFMRETIVTSVHVGSRAIFEDMNRVIAHHRLHPIIDKVFSFDQAQQAYDYLGTGAHFGKVVISVP